MVTGDADATGFADAGPVPVWQADKGAVRTTAHTPATTGPARLV